MEKKDKGLNRYLKLSHKTTNVILPIKNIEFKIWIVRTQFNDHMCIKCDKLITPSNIGSCFQ